MSLGEYSALEAYHGSCVDDSGNWVRGGMFDALSKLSNTVLDAYHRASEFKDLHLGDLHLINIDDNDDQQTTEESKPLLVALAVTQSYNPRRKVPRSSISILDLQRCLAKASFSASQKSGSWRCDKKAEYLTHTLKCGRADGQTGILEGKEIEFYMKKLQKKKGKNDAAAQ